MSADADHEIDCDLEQGFGGTKMRMSRLLVSGVLSASAFLIAGSPAHAALIAVEPTNNASADTLAVSGTGTASAGSVAVSGLGDTQGATAISGSGDATGAQAVSGVGTATGGTAISGTNNAYGDPNRSGQPPVTVAISGFGDAYGLVAASGYGDAYGSVAASALGNAYSDLVGSFSGSGQATGGQIAISILGDSYAGVLALSGDGQANSQIAVSILGNATGTGSAAGYPLELSVIDSLVVPVRDLTPGEFEGIYELARVLADTGQYSAAEITAIAVESALALANGVVPPT